MIGSANKRWVSRGVVGLVLASFVVAYAQAPNDAADVARLMELLDLHSNSVVADIGAGLGWLTVGIAPHVGRVYATDLEPARQADIRKAVDVANVKNVDFVLGLPSATNLPPASCDGIFMRDVSHHFIDPPAMNTSLLATLKSGAKLVVSDFPPRSGRTAELGHRDQGTDHGILPADLIRELQAAGFADVQQVPWSSPGYYAVIGRRP